MPRNRERLPGNEGGQDRNTGRLPAGKGMLLAACRKDPSGKGWGKWNKSDWALWVLRRLFKINLVLWLNEITALGHRQVISHKRGCSWWLMACFFYFISRRGSVFLYYIKTDPEQLPDPTCLGPYWYVGVYSASVR